MPLGPAVPLAHLLRLRQVHWRGTPGAAVARVDLEELTEAVLEKTDNETAKELKRMLDKCETISYAPNASQEGLEIDIERTQILLKKIGKMV